MEKEKPLKDMFLKSVSNREIIYKLLVQHISYYVILYNGLQKLLLLYRSGVLNFILKIFNHFCFRFLSIYKFIFESNGKTDIIQSLNI
jgi:hypothetical protein